MPDIGWTGTSYRDLQTGRFITRAQARRTLERSLENLVQLTDGLQADLRAGRISLETWRDEMRTVIKQTQMAAAELAKGGRAQMTKTDYGRVGQLVRRQYEFLENWVKEIQAGKVDGRMEGRAKLYLKAARSNFLTAEARAMSERGFFARNVLRPAEHCAECIGETRKGLVPVEFLAPIGTRQCLSNCKCYFVFQKVA